jgi:multiple sugar transport system ATP-binding protein
MLKIEGVSKTFGSQKVLDNISFNIRRGEIVVLTGPSGCGKTTLLHIIAGLICPDRGIVEVDYRSVFALDPYNSEVSMVFQGAADVFPWSTPREIIGFGIRKGRDRQGAAAYAVQDYVRLVHLPERLLDQKGRTLSGGERQRVSLARALAERPKFLLVDEPLSNLDTPLRRTLAAELRGIFEESGTGVVYVTHDLDEANVIGHRVLDFRAVNGT